jgi:hypothetical protein
MFATAGSAPYLLDGLGIVLLRFGVRGGALVFQVLEVIVVAAIVWALARNWRRSA